MSLSVKCKCCAPRPAPPPPAQAESAVRHLRRTASDRSSRPAHGGPVRAPSSFSGGSGGGGLPASDEAPQRLLAGDQSSSGSARLRPVGSGGLDGSGSRAWLRRADGGLMSEVSRERVIGWIRTWGTDKVQLWLMTCGFNPGRPGPAGVDVVAVFRAAGINGHSLLTMDDEALDLIGVADAGTRGRLLRYIHGPGSLLIPEKQ